jgi:hypothetical protein
MSFKIEFILAIILVIFGQNKVFSTTSSVLIKTSVILSLNSIILLTNANICKFSKIIFSETHEFNAYQIEVIFFF